MLGWKTKKNRGPARNAEVSGVMDGMLITGHAGFASGTHIASNMGWRPVDGLCVGDKVLTFDHGMQTITDIQREVLFNADMPATSSHCPLLLPEGALNNRKTLWMMPEQGLLVESDAAHDALGDPFAVIPARALRGYNGIEAKTPPPGLEVTTLAFANDEVIYIEGRLLAHCPRPRCILTDRARGNAGLYTVLDHAAGRDLVNGALGLEAFNCDPEEISVIDAMRDRRARPGRPKSV